MSHNLEVHEEEQFAEIRVDGTLVAEVSAPDIGPVRARVHEITRDDGETADWKWSSHFFNGGDG